MAVANCTFPPQASTTVGLMAVLEEAIQEIQILQYVIGVPTRREQQENVESKEEATKLEASVVTDIEDYDSELVKIQAERTQVEDILRSTYEEIKTNNSFSVLQNFVLKDKGNEEEEQRLETEEEELRLALKMKQKACEDMKIRAQEEINEMDLKIAKYKDDLQEAKISSMLQLEYAKNLDASKLEYWKQENENLERKLKVAIEKALTSLDQEKRCHTEMQSFFSLSIKKFKEQLEYWQHRYDEETTMKQQQLDELKMKFSRDHKTLTELKKLYEERRKIVQEHNDEKRRIQMEKEQQEKEMDAAIKIQSWWRGTMVRKCIGPYAKKRPKSKKDKKKGGKKQK